MLRLFYAILSSSVKGNLDAPLAKAAKVLENIFIEETSL
jgi:hypothetical protein